MNVPSDRIFGAIRWASLIGPVAATLAFAVLSWSALEREARTVVLEKARLIGDYAARLVEAQDLLITAAERGVSRFRPNARYDHDAHLFLSELAGRLPGVQGLALISPQGAFLLSSTTFPARGQVGQRDYLDAARAGETLFLDRMRVEPSGVDSLVVARRAPGSAFSGVWVSGVRIDLLDRFLAGIAADEDDAASLTRADGLILVRNAPTPEPVRLSEDHPAMRAYRAGERGILSVKSKADGVTRLYGFVRVDGLPVYANFGMSRMRMIEAWLRQVGLVGSLLGAAGVAAHYVTRAAERSVAAKAAATALSYERRLLEQASATAALRETMLKELNHRIKNNLQMIISMIRLQSGRPGGPDIARISGRLHAIAEIHDLLYRSADAFSVDLSRLMRSICESDAVASVDRSVRIVCDAAPIRASADVATPLALCVLELVTNALKHAFGPEGGEIRVALRPADDGALLTVADDGAGVPAAAERSSGLRIVNALIEQVGATMTVTIDGGTRYDIAFRPLQDGDDPPETGSGDAARVIDLRRGDTRPEQSSLPAA